MTAKQFIIIMLSMDSYYSYYPFVACTEMTCRTPYGACTPVWGTPALNDKSVILSPVALFVLH